jgi:hypothetical protein
MGLSLEHMSYVIPPVSSSPSSSPSTDFANSASSNPSAHIHERDLAQTTLDSHLHAVRGTSQNVSNRFFDKAFTLIVDPSTRAGATGEHSFVDALVPSIVAEYGVVQGVDVQAFDKANQSSSPELGSADGQGWERLDWVGDEKLWKECAVAQTRATEIVNDSDSSVLWFDGYGADWIKSMGSFSLSSCTYKPVYSTIV